MALVKLAMKDHKGSAECLEQLRNNFDSTPYGRRNLTSFFSLRARQMMKRSYFTDTTMDVNVAIDVLESVLAVQLKNKELYASAETRFKDILDFADKEGLSNESMAHSTSKLTNVLVVVVE